jgi:hypothetical protein
VGANLLFIVGVLVYLNQGRRSMADKRKKPTWKVTVESVYSFGREERLQSAYELVLPVERVQLKGNDDDTFKASQDRIIRQGVK